MQKSTNSITVNLSTGNQSVKRAQLPRKQQSGTTVHFGTLMKLFHEKHAECFVNEEEKVYKGRVVFRGDIVKDEAGYLAVFSEQGTHKQADSKLRI